MTDLELTKLCAEAMDLPHACPNGVEVWLLPLQDAEAVHNYQPLGDDAQAMALVKTFTLHILFNPIDGWRVGISGDGWKQDATPDLNRAICWCVARMQLSKSKENK